LKANNDQWWFYGITKDPTKNDLLLVYRYDSNLPESLLGVTLKCTIDGLIYKLHNTLNELMININYLSNKTNKMIKTTIETLKTIEDCINCKDKEVGRNGFDELRKLINEIGKKYYLVEDLFKINIRLNKEVLCEGCKRKEIRKLADKCRNEEVAKLLYECRLNARHHDDYIQWIPFDEFKNIEYLAKGGFGEVHKAIWINGFKSNHHDKVVLKRIHNSSNKTVDILKEVKVYY
jgi:hypothetical protein